ncbi:asparagine synthase (glutamine-hydrolyzing) [Alsobacter sp. R-9]
MCGIAGYWRKPVDEVLGRRHLQAMVGAISHRGPDGNGIWLEDGVGLAHARLSIIDLAGGAQPMAGDADDSVITFNGEIFNFVELRETLRAEGRVFRTTSDTEVILALYERDGLDFVSSMNGDFALGIWDRRRRRLVLARDRMGVRPLHFARLGDGIVFASEAKALLATGLIEPRVDERALDQIFTTWAPLAGSTAFAEIAEVPPGHVMVVEGDRITSRSYWQLTFPDASDDRIPTATEETELEQELLHLLTDATRIRLRADVPVGSYLSGGFDSSLVSALARNEVADRLRTFSVTFDDAEFDESPQQQAMVAALGTDHSAVHCRTSDIAAVFPDVVRHTERPILRTAPAPLYLLAREVHRAGYKVVLTGEGADEVFAGYDIFKEAKIRAFCARQPNSAFRGALLRKLYPYLPAFRGQPQRYLESFFGVGEAHLEGPLASHMPRFRSTSGAKDFFSADLRRRLADYDALADLRERLPADFVRWHPLNQAQYLETVHLLPNYILCSQGDRMAMAHGVEGRFPFLDHRVVEFAAKLPTRLKLKVLREKHLLRQAARTLLPPEIGNRTKQPYRAPDSQSFVGEGAPAYVNDVLAPANVSSDGLFDPHAVRLLHQKCSTGRFIGNRQNMAFVGVLSTLLWRRDLSAQTGETRARLSASA